MMAKSELEREIAFSRIVTYQKQAFHYECLRVNNDWLRFLDLVESFSQTMESSKDGPVGTLILELFKTYHQKGGSKQESQVQSMKEN